MALKKINNFSEIEFETVDANADIFQLPDGQQFCFSEYVCHICWAGGTVLESLDSPKTYHCVLCGRELIWHEFENDFIEPLGDRLSFLLPVDFGETEKNNWYQEYRKSRSAQEKVRENILRFGKE